MAEHKMTVVEGVRYRPEDVPDEREQRTESGTATTADAQHKARRVSRSSRSGDHASE